MTSSQKIKRVFIAGGTGFVGRQVAAILAERGAEVTLLVRENDNLIDLGSRVHLVQGDPWNPASLRGRGRGHDAVIHLVGGVRTDPRRGLTFKQLNYVSAHNIAQMAMGDGVPHVLFLSAAANPFGVPGAYLESKRDAEYDLKQVGVAWTIIRAPAIFVPGTPRNSIYRMISLLSYVPLLSTLLVAYRPISLDTAAYGIASLALSAEPGVNRMIGPRQLRRAGKHPRRPRAMPAPETVTKSESEPDEPPFGWSPHD